MKILTQNKAFLMKLAKLESLDFGAEIVKPELSGVRVVGKSELIVPLLGLLDLEAEKEKIREKINLIEKEENYQEAEDKLTLQLKKTYLGNIQQFMDLSTKQQELEQEKKAYSNSELKKKLGKISKNEFLNSEKEYYTKEKGYLDAVLSMYQSIDGYEKLYDKK